MEGKPDEHSPGRDGCAKAWKRTGVKHSPLVVRTPEHPGRFHTSVLPEAGLAIAEAAALLVPRRAAASMAPACSASPFCSVSAEPNAEDRKAVSRRQSLVDLGVAVAAARTSASRSDQGPPQTSC